MKSVLVSLLIYPKYLQPNKNRFILSQALKFGKFADDTVLFRLGERKTTFSSRFLVNQLFKIRGHVSITDFEDKYLKEY